MQDGPRNVSGVTGFVNVSLPAAVLPYSHQLVYPQFRARRRGPALRCCHPQACVAALGTAEFVALDFEYSGLFDAETQKGIARKQSASAQPGWSGAPSFKSRWNRVQFRRWMRQRVQVICCNANLRAHSSLKRGRRENEPNGNVRLEILGASCYQEAIRYIKSEGT